MTDRLEQIQQRVEREEAAIESLKRSGIRFNGETMDRRELKEVLAEIASLRQQRDDARADHNRCLEQRNAIGAQELILPDHPTDADIPDIPGWLPSGSPHWRIVASWQFAGAVKVRLFFPTASGAGGVVMPAAKGAQSRNLRRGN